MKFLKSARLTRTLIAAALLLPLACSTYPPPAHSLPPAQSSPPVPGYTLTEAETDPHGAIKEDPAAFGGAYVEQTGGYQPMLIAPLPAAGDSWVLWARLRDVNLQLKAVQADGSQKELNWEWTRPDEWTWVSFGRHTRAELGAKALLMRGPDAGAHPDLDAVVFAQEDAFNPNTDLTQPKVTYPPVAVTLDWKTAVAQATPLSYGLNAFGAFDPAVTQSAAYESQMAWMHPGLLRLHNWGMMGDSQTDAGGWIDNAHQSWDAVKIKKALTGAYAYGPALLINIPGWPAWMDKDKNNLLDADQTAAYAQFCAQLVKIVNKDLKHHAVYWEVTNERDGPYYGDFHDNGGALKDPAKPDRLADLAAIYNAAAVAMKAVDPTIKVGGPAVARPDWTDFVTRFVAATAPHLDFFSFHAYASGSKDDSDRQIFDRTAAFAEATRQIAGILKAASPTRPILLFFDEYNISWTWETRDPRMTDVKGAVFDALTVTSSVLNGVTGTTAWNECDGIYGKMDPAYHLRPGATLFHWLNSDLCGTVIAASSADPAAVAVYAVKSADKHQALLLINRSAHDRVVQLPPWGKTAPKQRRLTPTGESPATPAGQTLSLPAASVTLVTD